MAKKRTSRKRSPVVVWNPDRLRSADLPPIASTKKLVSFLNSVGLPAQLDTVKKEEAHKRKAFRPMWQTGWQESFSSTRKLTEYPVIVVGGLTWKLKTMQTSSKPPWRSSLKLVDLDRLLRSILRHFDMLSE